MLVVVWSVLCVDWMSGGCCVVVAPWCVVVVVWYVQVVVRCVMSAV